MKQARSTRVPTWDDYLAFDGEHCQRLWEKTDDYWRCPGCNRTKFELLRWTRKIWPEGNIPYGTPHMGWKAGLHLHHDHNTPPRFREILVCTQCNGVDAAVKNYFKGQIHSEFSFSPDEILQLVKAKAHDGHSIDFELAFRIYRSVTCQTGKPTT